MSAEEQQALMTRIIDLTTAYLDANIQVKGTALNLSKSEKKIVNELEDLIQEVLSSYRNLNDISFEGLSGIIQQKLANLEKIELEKLPKDSTIAQAKANRQALLNNNIETLKMFVQTDIEELMTKPWSKLVFSRYVEDYGTERKKGSFSLSLGYGGVYLDGKLNDISYGSAPYVGVALPLSNSTIAPNFLRNSSIVMGAFLQNFEDSDGNTVTGLIVERPIYFGLDYKLFQFVRFNAGAAFLDRQKEIMGDDGKTRIDNNTLIRPFIGLSARIDLSLKFGE